MDGKNMSIKDSLIKKVSLNLSVDERIVREVVDHQFDGAREAMALYTSIEFSGFGKFFFNKKRAVRKMQKWKETKETIETYLKDESLSQRKRITFQIKLQDIIGNMKLLKEKMERYETVQENKGNM